MEELGSGRPPQHARQLDLAAGGLEQVHAPDDKRDALLHVVHGGGELVSPETVAVTDEEVAALFRGDLRLRSESKVVEVFFRARQADAEATAGGFGELFIVAGPRIPKFVGVRGGRSEDLRYRGTRALAGVD